MSDAPFRYRHGVLHAEGVALPRIAKEVGTPCWIYSAAALEARYRAFTAAFSGLDALVCYSLKANSNQGIIATLGRLGSGVDVVSAGEMQRALAAGIPPSKIVFAGIGKTADEMAQALDAGILQFNVESEPELRLLSKVAMARKKTAPISLRVNPDVDARTHAKIATGKKENKFGIDIAQAADVAQLAKTLPGISLQGLAVHIGSQVTDVDPYHAAFARLGELARELNGNGHRITRLDFGGGLGVVYDRASNSGAPPALASYADAVRGALAKLPNGGKGTEIVLAPGRWLVAEAGILLTRVVYMKHGAAKRFAIVDAAMNDLIRPTLYEAHHPMRPVIEPGSSRTVTVDVVGPVCETGDFLALDRALPPLQEGDLLAIEMAGAYGAVMSSTYNARPLAPELLVQGESWAVIRPRQTVESLIALDRLPPWIKPAKTKPRGAKGRNRASTKRVSQQRSNKKRRRPRG
jgi:diaminopimelate decarboxylase